MCIFCGDVHLFVCMWDGHDVHICTGACGSQRSVADVFLDLFVVLVELIYLLGKCNPQRLYMDVTVKGKNLKGINNSTEIRLPKLLV